MADEEIDLVIIGAGWYGLAMAKTYHEVYPSARIRVLEKAASIGGVWASERLYPGLRTNNLLGTYEFSDFPMDGRAFGVKKGEHIPGEVVHRYLEAFAEHFGIRECVELRSEVTVVERKEPDAFVSTDFKEEAVLRGQEEQRQQRRRSSSAKEKRSPRRSPEKLPPPQPAPPAGKWLITGIHMPNHSTTRTPFTLLAHKLVIATGVTSEPSLPCFPGQPSFAAPLFHVKDTAQHAHLFGGKPRTPPPYAVPANPFDLAAAATATATTPAVANTPITTTTTSQNRPPLFRRRSSVYQQQQVHSAHLAAHPRLALAVLGATKAGYDAVAALAAAQPASRPLVWIVRPGGHGPCWVVPRAWAWLAELLVHVRLASWLSPCAWGDADGYAGARRFASLAALGRLVACAWWWLLQAALLWGMGYAEGGAEGLRPWAGVFWVASGCAVENYGGGVDVLGLVRSGRVRVVVADVERLDGADVCLSNGERVAVGALVCATGWVARPPVAFAPARLESELGVCDRVLTRQERVLAAKADREIQERFPLLCARSAKWWRCPGGRPTTDPRREDPENPKAPYRLHRFMVPPAFVEERNVAFAGMLLNMGTAMCAQVQALWLTAYLGGQLPITQSRDEIEYESTLHSRFGLWRCPGGFAARFPDFAFDAIPYFDSLLRDLGLNRWRKRNWLRECVMPYGPWEYKGLVAEWLSKSRFRLQSLRV